MPTNYDNLQALLDENKELVSEVDRLHSEFTQKRNILLELVSDLSSTFEEEDEEHDELVECVNSLAEKFEYTWNENSYGLYHVGDRIEFWVRSNC